MDETTANPAVVTDTKDWTGTRRVLRYKLDFDKDGLAAVNVGTNPTIVHAGTGTSPTVCLWVEEDGAHPDTDKVEVITVQSIPTGGAVPVGAVYLAFFIEPTLEGFAIRHLYRL